MIFRKDYCIDGMEVNIILCNNNGLLSEIRYNILIAASEVKGIGAYFKYNNKQYRAFVLILF